MQLVLFFCQACSWACSPHHGTADNKQKPRVKLHRCERDTVRLHSMPSAPGTGQITTALTVVLWRWCSSSLPSGSIPLFVFTRANRPHKGRITCVRSLRSMCCSCKCERSWVIARSFDVPLISVSALIYQSNRIWYRGQWRDERFPGLVHSESLLP